MRIAYWLRDVLQHPSACLPDTSGFFLAKSVLVTMKNLILLSHDREVVEAAMKIIPEACVSSCASDYRGSPGAPPFLDGF